MNALAQELLGVCKGYLGPAASAFLHRELREIGTDANRVDARVLQQFAEAAMLRAETLMGPAKAAELRTQLLGCGVAARVPAGGHKLANDAASRLLTKGNGQGAVTAYRELAAKDGDVASFSGLAEALVMVGDREGAVQALRHGAGIRLRANDRPGELELLADAVLVAPTDLAAHRRLAAALANYGDLAGACYEYRRFVDAVLERGDQRRAWLELAYAREILGELPDLLAVVDRLTAGSAPEPWWAVDAARSAPAAAASKASPPAPSFPESSANEPIDFQKAALRRRFRDTGQAAAPSVDVEGVIAALVPEGAPPQAATIAHMRATVLIAARDPRARAATLDAARRLLTIDRPRAAADILLMFINAGSEAREAHLVLAEAIRRMGRPDLAEEKCRLVAKLHQLDGDKSAADTAELAALAVRAASQQAGVSA